MKQLLVITLFLVFTGSGICREAGGVLIPKGNGIYEDLDTGAIIIKMDEIERPAPGASQNPGPYTGSQFSRTKRYKSSREGRESINVDTGETRLDIGGGESINIQTGDRILDIGDGYSINMDTGEQIQELGDEERINVDTGERMIEID